MSSLRAKSHGRGRHSGPKTFGSDLLVDLLRKLGIGHVALNPGATIRGFHDSLVNAEPSDIEVVLTTHEGIAVAMAHGFAKVTGRPMAVGLHNIVGLQHAAMALFNAWCDRVPILVIGGSGPVAESKRRPWIDWVHAARQGELVRDYVKWEHEPAELEALLRDVIRGWQIATTHPQGPVYLGVDTSLQEQVADPPVWLTRTNQAQSASSLEDGVLDREQLQRIASRIAASHRPVILAWGIGRRGATRELAEFAELLGAPVIEWTRAGTSIPSRHRLNATQWFREVLSEADLVLGLNVQNLAGMLVETDDMTRENRLLVSEDTPIILIGDDTSPISSWTNEHGEFIPVDATLNVDAARVLPDLLRFCRSERIRAASNDSYAPTLATLRRDAEESWERTAAQISSRGLTSANIAFALRQALEGRAWVLANGTAGGWVHRLWSFDADHPYLGDSGGAGKGYGLGAATGAALGIKGSDSIAVSIQGDGDLLYTPGALWTAVHHRLPLLVVVLNNRSYFQDERHQREMARARGRESDNVSAGIRIEDPIPDYAGLARSFGMAATGPIATMAELSNALRAAIPDVAAGKPVLLDCLIVEDQS